MKKLLFITLSFLIFSCNPETVSYTTGSESDVGGVLNGKVKKYSVKYYNAKSSFGDISKADKRKFDFKFFHIKTHTYDVDGNLKESVTLDNSKTIFKYDGNGNRLEYKKFDSNGNITNVWKFEYDSNFYNIKSSSFDSEGNLSYYTRHLFDSKGQKYESIQYDKKEDLNRKTERTYGDSGKVIESIEYDKNEEISSKHTYIYDSISGNKIAQKYFKIKTYSGDTRTAKGLYKYFKDEGLIPESFNEWNKGVAKKPSLQSKIFTIIVDASNYKYEKTVTGYLPNPYGGGGKGFPIYSEPAWYNDMPNSLKIPNDTGFDEWLKKVFPTPYKKLALENETTYDYNDKGDLILENKNGELKEYKYDYDEYENWIVKYEYLYGKIKYMTERNIEYYK